MKDYHVLVDYTDGDSDQFDFTNLKDALKKANNETRWESCIQAQVVEYDPTTEQETIIVTFEGNFA